MFNTIIWATDGSEAADRALPYAKSLAGHEGAKLIVVHSAEVFTGSRASGLPLYADEDSVKAKVESQVNGLRAAGLDVEGRMEATPAGRPAHAIADVARELGADLIVVGTRGQTPIGGLLLGSVTQRLLHIAPCPVLVTPAASQGEDPEREAAVGSAADA